MKNSSILMLMVLIFLGCSKENDNPVTQIPSSFFNNPLVNTGYYAYSINGSLIRVMGIPNTQREITINNVDYSIVTFPNPRWYQSESVGQDFWNIGLSPSFQAKTGKVWLMRASQSEDFSPFVQENGSTHQAIGQPAVVWQGTYQGTRLQVPIPAAEDADFRLYLEIEGYLLYDNLVVREFLTY
jgi:hypothetical protein